MSGQRTKPNRVANSSELLKRCDFPEAGSKVDCGLSGGPDSAALVALAVASGLEVTAWHINHGLRASAQRDQEAAAAIVELLGVEFRSVSVDVEPGPHLEERARKARYAALPAGVLVGHTADDRAETVLFNIARGAGLAGAAAPFARVRRPLLALRRRETRELSAQLGLPVVSDPMNDDLAYSRVAIRHRVLPALAEALGRDPVPLLNRHADLAADAFEVVTLLSSQVDPTSAAELCAAPRAVASEALRRWIARTTGVPAAVSAASIDRVLEVAAGHFVATEVTGGHRVSRSRGRLSIDVL